MPEDWEARAKALEAERDEARFRPLGDNHHNALKCPHCNPEGLDPAALEARAQAAESRLALAEKVVEAGMDLQAATNTSRTWSVMEAQAWEALQVALTAYEENTSSNDLTTGEDDA